MIAHLKKAIAIRLELFPWARCIWRFDHSSNHTAKAPDALNVYAMNIGPGGLQAKMRCTTVLNEDSKLFNKKQEMVYPNDDPHHPGEAKGLKQVLLERWGQTVVDTFYGKGTTAKDRKKKMQLRLASDLDFASERTIIHDVLAELCPDDICRFYPKFHCEFPPIERFWCGHKRYCRSHCGGNIEGLRKVVAQGLDAVCSDSVRRYFAHGRRYEACYRLGLKSDEINRAVRLTRYASHRRVSVTSTGIAAALDELGITEANTKELQGLCYCCACTGKPSICQLARCPTHAANAGDAPDSVLPRLPYVQGRRRKKKADGEEVKGDGEDSEGDCESDGGEIWIVCETQGCLRWREVEKAVVEDARDEMVARGSEFVFSCDMKGVPHGGLCDYCDRDPCRCRCGTCRKGNKNCRCQKQI